MRPLTLHGELPTEARAIAELAVRFLRDDLVAGRVRNLTVLTFRGSEGRQWELHDPPGSPDDVVRAIAARECADALACVVPLSGHGLFDVERTFRISVEVADGRVDSLLTQRGEDVQVVQRTEPPHARWLGVEPHGEVALWEEGPVYLFGPRAEA